MSNEKLKEGKGMQGAKEKTDGFLHELRRFADSGKKGDFDITLNNYHAAVEYDLMKYKLTSDALAIALWDMEVISGDPVNPNNTFTWSQEFRFMLGYSDKNDFPDILSSWSDRLHPDDKERTLKAFEAHISDRTGKTPYDVEYQLMLKDGSYRYFHAFGTTQRDGEGVPLRVAGALRDIEEKKQTDNQLLQAQGYLKNREKMLEELVEIRTKELNNALDEAKKAYAEAEIASEAKSRFIANMSHEMRTPMNVIVGLTELLLEEGETPDKIKETLKKIDTAGNTLTGLINDVLDISKIEASRLELHPVQYDVPSLLNDIITLNIIRIKEKPVTFKLDIESDVPCTLFGDDIRVKQILNNLLSNAFKYTEKGSITLSVRSTTNQQPQTTDSSVWVSFYISDTGIGIRAEDMAKLFSDYNQVDTKASRENDGSGFGLRITKRFVELMDGEITLESEYGKGTTFRVRIRQGFVTEKPIAKEILETLNSFRYSERKKQVQEKLVRADLSYARVLVVDDFPTNLDVAAGMLLKYKMQVDCVQSGQEAVDSIAAGEPVYDAVFMDHMMPGMDGVEAAKTIRASGTKYAENIPIIALTANAVAGSEQMFLNNGFNAFLPKPFNKMLLDAVVRQWVKKK